MTAIRMAIDERLLHNGGYLADPWRALNLEYPGLEEMRRLHALGQEEAAAARLLDYYRQSPHLYPGGSPAEEAFVELFQMDSAYQSRLDALLREANETRQHLFWVGYPRSNPGYGKQWASADEIDWRYAPYTDTLEWTYSLNRHAFWISLARAWRLTGDDSYIQSYCEQVESWLHQCPRPSDYSRATHTPPREPWRTIEAGIRSRSWITAMSLARFSSAMQPLTWLRLLASLAEHAEFLEGFYPAYGRLGNWGVLQTQGLLHIAFMLPELRGAARWRELGLARMDDMAQVQVQEDGYHWETTPGYHHVFILCYLEVYGLCKHAGLREPAFLSALRRALDAQIALAQPDLHYPMLSDTDSQNSDIRDDLTYAAFLLEDPQLKAFAHDHLSYEACWLWGTQAARRYADLPRADNLTRPASAYLPTAGFAVMRSGWERDARCLMLVSSPVTSAHRHDDIGHIELHAYGRHFLSDVSFHSYIATDPLRRTLKEAPAHNTFVVDTTSPSFYLDQSHWQGSRPLDAYWRAHTTYEYAQIAQAGYLRLASPVLTTRRIFYLKSDGEVPDYWLLVDHAEAAQDASHRFQQRFHFPPPPGGIRADSATRQIVTEFTNSANLHLVAVQEDAHVRLEEGLASPIAYSHEPTTIGVIEYRHEGNLLAPVLLWPRRAGEPHVLPQLRTLVATTLDPLPLPSDVSFVLAVDFGVGRRDLFALNLSGACASVVEETLFFGEIGVLRQRPDRDDHWLRVK